MNFARSLLYSSASSALSGCSGSGLVTIFRRLSITGGQRECVKVTVHILYKTLKEHNFKYHTLETFLKFFDQSKKLEL